MVRKVEVVPYDSIWPALFQKEVDRISNDIGNAIDYYYHMGSTAVPGLAAKPTIDILAVADSLQNLDSKKDVMSELGYQVKGEHGIPGRRYYQKLSGEVHLYHIHAFEKEHPEITRYLNFRDFLQTNLLIREAYQQLKQKLAQKFMYDATSYTAGKSEFIRQVDKQAAEWRKHHPRD
jgi:GrpB-like predicted nucleotidyltransferase (UPF0157 family)